MIRIDKFTDVENNRVGDMRAAPDSLSPGYRDGVMR
jgi:hypothetical protein